MPERLTSTSKARAELRRLSQSAQKHLDRYIITVRGMPQSVLIGFDEYQSMKAAVELLQRPEIVQDIRAGLKQLDEGKGVPLTEMKARVHNSIRSRETKNLAEELAVESGVDQQIVQNVMGLFGQKMVNVFSANGSMIIPGVGEVVVKKPRVDPIVQGGIPLARTTIRSVSQNVSSRGTGRVVKAAQVKQVTRRTEKDS